MQANSAFKRELELLREWYEYNSQVRREYLRLLARIPVKQLTQDRGASFPSLLDIFTHVLDAYRWWFLFVYHDRIHEWKRLRETGLTLKEVRAETLKIDSTVMHFLDDLKPRDLDRVITFHEEMPDRSKITTSYTLRDILWHMIEEELQHRGELNALLWQIDIDPPITEWQDWKKQSTMKRKR